MKDTKKTVSFIVHPEGYIALDNFRPRTLYEALYFFLEEDWDTSREALSQSIPRSADLLSLLLIIRKHFEFELMQETEKVVEELKKDNEKHSSSQGLAKDGKGKSDKESEKVFDILGQLTPIYTTSITSWVNHLSDKDFSKLIVALKSYLDIPVAPFHDVFSKARDTATGAAVHIMRGLPPFDQDILELEYSSNYDLNVDIPEFEEAFDLLHTPDFVSTKLTVAKANKVVKELDLPFVFRKEEAKKKAKKAKKSH